MAPRKSAAVTEAEAVVDAAFSQAPEAEGEKVSTPSRPSRSIRETKSRKPKDFSRSLTAFKFLDVLDMAYENGFIGFLDSRVEAVTTFNKSGNPQTTYIAMAVATFREDDGTERGHVGWGEANYENCSTTGTSALRMAETRAQGRALARALNLDANFDYEMHDPENPGESAIPNSRTNQSQSNVRSSSGSSVSNIPTVTAEAYPEQNVPGGWACEVCGEQLKDTANYTAGRWAFLSKRDHDQVLCYTHVKAAKAAKAAKVG